MEHVAQGTTANLASRIGALELPGAAPGLAPLSDAAIESMYMGPDPTRMMNVCPTYLCGLTKAAGCHV